MHRILPNPGYAIDPTPSAIICTAVLADPNAVQMSAQLDAPVKPSLPKTHGHAQHERPHPSRRPLKHCADGLSQARAPSGTPARLQGPDLKQCVTSAEILVGCEGNGAATQTRGGPSGS